MKTSKNIQLASAAIIAASLSFGVTLRAETSGTAPTFTGMVASQGQLQTVAFSDRPEAAQLREAYKILAAGDHDYGGYRVKAMRQVKAAAKLLGVDLGGDDYTHERQALSDDKMRHVRDLLAHLLDVAEVKDQEKISQHIHLAMDLIDRGLAVH